MTATQDKKYFSKERISRILPATLVSVGLFLMLFIVGPIEIFANNVNEFGIPLNSFVGYLVLYFFIAVTVSFSALFFTPRKVYIVLYIAAVFAFLILFCQSTFLNFGSHTLPGDNLEEEINVALAIVDVLLWGIVLAGLILAAIYIKNKGLFNIICIVISIALVVSQVASIVTTTIASANDLTTSSELTLGDPVNYLTTKNLTTISKNKNIFVFCIDRFDGIDYAEPAMEEHPEVFENLTGFTYFKDDISVYGHTYPAVVNMLTNVKTGEMQREEFFEYAYNNNNTLASLDELGYQINVFTERYYGYEPYVNLPDYVDNAVHTVYNFHLNSPHKVAWLFVRMEIYKCLPLPLKTVLMQDLSSSSVEQYVPADAIDEIGEKLYSVDMKFVYDYVSKKQFEVVDQNIFSFVHLFGCHSVKYDENWNLVNTSIVTDLFPSVKNSFSIIDFYIDALKESGAYENATIIITGDHGKANNELADKYMPTVTAMFVKPSGVSEGDIKISAAQVSHENIWATIFQSENISYSQETYGRSMFDISETETITRTYIWDYNWHISLWTRAIWQIIGDGHDFDNWEWQENINYNRKMLD